MSKYCILPEQTASYSICLNDDVIIEGVPVVTNTDSCNYNPSKSVEEIKKNPVYYDNVMVDNFQDYYKLLLKK